MTTSCSCASTSHQADDLLDAFAAARAGCPALRDVLVPDSDWPGFAHWHTGNSFNLEAHCSTVMAAFIRGHVGRISSPIHRFLLRADGGVRDDVVPQYREDLRERWMHDDDAIRRHHQSKNFLSRLVELHVAEWLEQSGWRIRGLEATGAPFDIEATDPQGADRPLEVKFIGASDAEFRTVVAALQSDFVGESVSAYTPINYLLFRIYEAAKQLSSSPRGTAIAVIDDLTWWRYDTQLQTPNWIDWRRPTFYSNEAAWDDFLESQRARYPGLPGDLATTIRSADVWIMKRSYGYSYSRILEISE